VLDDHAGLTVESLLDAIDGCADWRTRTATEHPGDPRHANAAAALRELATWVRANRGDGSVRAVVAVQAANPDLDLTWPISGRAGRALSRYGFDFAAAVPPPAFLAGLGVALQDDVAETRDRGRSSERRLDEP
jgi:hypothetical protein